MSLKPRPSGLAFSLSSSVMAVTKVQQGTVGSPPPSPGSPSESTHTPGRLGGSHLHFRVSSHPVTHYLAFTLE